MLLLAYARFAVVLLNTTTRRRSMTTQYPDPGDPEGQVQEFTDLEKYLGGFVYPESTDEESTEDLSRIMKHLVETSGAEGQGNLVGLMMQGVNMQQAIANMDFEAVLEGLPALIRSVRESAKLLDPTAQELVNTMAGLVAWLQRQSVRLADERKELTSELARVDAEKKRAKYEALKNAGFTPKQSMDLLLTEMATSAAAQNQALGMLGNQMNTMGMLASGASQQVSRRRRITIPEEDR